MALLFLVLICVFIFQIARKQGVSPWMYVVNYISIFFAVGIVISCICIAVFGQEAIMSEQGMKTAELIQPFILLFEIILFLFFRKQILKARTPVNNDDDYNRPEPPKEKKDLSYFR